MLRDAIIILLKVCNDCRCRPKFYRLLPERLDELRLGERDGREELLDLLLELGLEKLPGLFVGFVVVLEGVNVFGLWDGFRVDGF